MKPLIKNLKFDFVLLDLNYTAILVACIMLLISIFILKKSHKVANENPNKHGLVSLISYILFYFLVIGFIWIGITLDFVFGKRQKW